MTDQDQYSNHMNYNCNPLAELSLSQWNGSQNGIVAFLCKGATSILGAIDVRGKDYIKGIRDAN